MRELSTTLLAEADAYIDRKKGIEGHIGIDARVFKRMIMGYRNYHKAQETNHHGLYNLAASSLSALDVQVLE